MGKRTTTVYVNTEGFGDECLAVYTHKGGDPTELEDGIYLSGQITESSAVVVVDEAGAGRFISTVNHMPGCSVRGYEIH